MTSEGPARQILIIEDNLDDVELTRLALLGTPFIDRLHTIQDGDEALRYLLGDDFLQSPQARHSPALVLLDLNLPKIDGLEVLRAVRSVPRMRYVPIVILSTSSELNDMRISYERGANSYIRKPMHYEHFKQMVLALTNYWLNINRVPNEVGESGSDE